MCCCADADDDNRAGVESERVREGGSEKRDFSSSHFTFHYSKHHNEAVEHVFFESDTTCEPETAADILEFAKI